MRLPSLTSPTSNNPHQWLISVAQVIIGAGAVAGLLILTLNVDNSAGRQAAGRIAVAPPAKLPVPVSISTMPRPTREVTSPLLTPTERPSVAIHEAPQVGAVAPMEPMELPESYQPLPQESYFPKPAASSTPKPSTDARQHAAKDAGQKPGQKPVQEATMEDPAFQRYLEWVRAAEEERARLRRQGPDVERQLDEEALPAPVTEASPAAPPPTQRRVSAAVTATDEALRTAEGRLSRTKPPVPPDCASFDRYYARALEAEQKAISDLVRAAAERDSTRLNSLRRDATSPVDSLLRSANDELARVHRARGAVNSPPRLETGDGASLLGELTRPGALK